MTATIYAGPSRPFEYDRCGGTKPDGLLESTLQAYEIRELTERELGQFFAEIVFEHVSEDASIWTPTTDTRMTACGARREKNPV
jgi:hypothetical protein